jgi:hypothetical protein
MERGRQFPMRFLGADWLNNFYFGTVLRTILGTSVAEQEFDLKFFTVAADEPER